MKLTIAYEFTPKRPSLNACQVMDCFGVAFDAGRHVVAEDVELRPRPGDAVYFTGPSGSGKSSLLRELARGLAAKGQEVLNLEELTWENRPLVDLLPLPLPRGLELLAACGLGEAQLLLRTPGELSEGQRYRFRLALALAKLTGLPAEPARWLLADEFTATLDRTLAQVVAFALARLARRLGVGLLLASTHEDITDDLRPHLLVRCDLGGQTQVQEQREAAPAVSRFFPVAGSVPAPQPTGRTSLGGITAATTFPSSARSCSSGRKTSRLASASSRPRRRRCGSATASSAAGRAVTRSG